METYIAIWADLIVQLVHEVTTTGNYSRGWCSLMRDASPFLLEGEAWLSMFKVLLQIVVCTY